MANILYNTAKNNIYDAELYENFEKQMPYVSLSMTRKNNEIRCST